MGDRWDAPPHDGGGGGDGGGWGAPDRGAHPPRPGAGVDHSKTDIVTLPGGRAAPSNLPEVGSKGYRATVCKFWLKGTCLMGDRCHFLHREDRDRLPLCDNLRTHGRCTDLECRFRHEQEDLAECNMYRLGFCVYGPTCRFRHAPRPGPPPDPRTVPEARPRQARGMGGGAGRGGGRGF